MARIRIVNQHGESAEIETTDREDFRYTVDRAFSAIVNAPSVQLEVEQNMSPMELTPAQVEERSDIVDAIHSAIEAEPFEKNWTPRKEAVAKSLDWSLSKLQGRLTQYRIKEEDFSGFLAKVRADAQAE